jgi:hypothetical protein
MSLRHTMMRMSLVITLVGGIAAGPVATLAAFPCSRAAFSSPASASLSAAAPLLAKLKPSCSAYSSPLSFLLASAATEIVQEQS